MARRLVACLAALLWAFPAFPAPQDQTALLLEAARTGQPLPPGDLWFQPPVVLEDVVGLRGSPDGTTVLRAFPSAHAPAALLTIKTTLPGERALGIPTRRVFRDFRLIGNGPAALEYCLLWDAGHARVERVDILDCYIGLAIKWAVDVAVRDSLFTRNACHIYIPGSGANTVTTVRFSGLQLREASDTAVLIQTGLGISFNDWTVIESNANAGLVIQPGPHGGIQHVHLDDVWFENNPVHLVDPLGIARIGHVWFEQGSRQR